MQEKSLQRFLMLVQSRREEIKKWNKMLLIFIILNEVMHNIVPNAASHVARSSLKQAALDHSENIFAAHSK